MSTPAVAGGVVVAALLLATGVICGQAWERSGEVRDRDAADAMAPFNRGLATFADDEKSEDALTYHWTDDTKKHAVVPIADAMAYLVEKGGRPGWPTSQPTPTVAAGGAAKPMVAGLNAARIKTGQAVFQRFGCGACHTTDGSAGVGPSLLNVFGSHIELSTGALVAIDADYIRESIRQPAAKVHKGYTPVMPDFGPQIKDKEVEGVLEFLKSISPDPASRKETGPLAAPPPAPH